MIYNLVPAKNMMLPIFVLIFVVMIAPENSAARAAENNYFDMSKTRSNNLSPFPKWLGMVRRARDAENLPDEECGKADFHPCVIKEWKALIDDNKDKSLREQLDIVNDWGNTHPYIIDQLNWGVEDYWETPNEFMSVNGDCEDYAIAKYFSLRSMGVPEDKMEIIIVQDFNLGGIIHAVLGVHAEEGLMILDNQIAQTMPAQKIYHYRPIYSINEHWWGAYYQQ